MITIAHKIELKPNDKQKTHFRKAFGCARLAYNWGLAEWERQYREGLKPTGNKINNLFNSIKKEQFPFVYEVNKYATQHAFKDLQDAYSRYFKHLGRLPKFKKRRESAGSYYIGGDKIKFSDVNPNSKNFRNMPHNQKQKYQYVMVQNLGYVRMKQRLRFKGKVMNMTISQKGDKFYASFTVAITEEEYYRTHPKAKKQKKGSVGIDLGLKSAMVTSDGIDIKNPRIEDKTLRKISRLQRHIEKKVCAKTKQDAIRGVRKSNNYCKHAKRIANAMRKVADRRKDFIDKVSTILTCNYESIVMEGLRPSKMVHNHKLARCISDMSFGNIRRRMTYKAQWNGVNLLFASQVYPSSQICSACGYQNKAVRNMGIRKWTCPHCGAEHHRDINAATNLRSLLYKENIGVGCSELTPADFAALLSSFDKNGVATRKIETGTQH